jgi:methyl-accepting chemotaxis protein
MPRNPSEELLSPDQGADEQLAPETLETIAKRIEHLDELEHQVLAAAQANGQVLDQIKEAMDEFRVIVEENRGLLDRAKKLSQFATHLPTRNPGRAKARPDKGT